MSDYMFILESHLSPEQHAVMTAVQAVAADANISLFLTGGAMRDVLGGFPIRDLDFTVEGPALKLAKEIAKRSGATILSTDEHRKIADLRFPNGVQCEISMARQEKYTKTGGKPQVTPGTIHEDLRGRDFTMDAIGLSLNRASRGLMIDPTNGASDIERREIRNVSNYGLYDDPSRLLRLIRFRVRFGYEIEERTKSQYANAREAEVESYIQPRALYQELRQISMEPKVWEVISALESEKLLALFSPVWTGAKLNPGAFQKIEKVRGLIHSDGDFKVDWYALILNVLTQNLTAKEKAALVQQTAMEKEEADPWQKLEARAKKLEAVLKAPKLNRASLIYDTITNAPGEQVLYLYLNSTERLVQDRIKNYFGKYILTADEVTDAEVSQSSGLTPSDDGFAKARLDMIFGYLDGRLKRPVPPEPEPEPEPAAVRGPGRPPRAK